MVQVAPICWQRISAAGPGKFRAKLRIRTPLSGRREGVVAEWMLVGVGIVKLCVEFRAMIEAIIEALHLNGPQAGRSQATPR